MPGDRTARRAARAPGPGRLCRSPWRKENGPRCLHRSPNHAMRCEITLRSILPVHAEAVAALVALHLFGLSRDVLSLVTPGAHEMRLVHYAPRLRSIFPDVDGVLGNAHFNLVHVQHDPRLAGLFDDAVPRASPQALLLGALTAAPGPSEFGHGLLHFLGAAFPHEHEDCRLRGDQILRSLERDLDGGLA